MTRRFDLLVFDWDGTLMDSEYRIVACLQAAIAELGLPPRSAAETRHIIGLGLVEACAALYPQHPPVAHAALAEAYKRQFLQHSRVEMRLFDGAAEVVGQLAAAGYRLAVATGKSRAGLARAFAETGLAPLFEASRCADETASKPDPLMLHELLDELDVAPARAVMIGDTAFDLAMAQAAGVPGIAATYGVHGREHLAAHAPLAWLDAITELPAVLDRLAQAPA